MLRRAVFALCGMLALLPTAARGHYLFTRICPPAEGGRVAEVYFSELAAAGDPRYIDKISRGKFFTQTKPGQFLPVEMRAQADRLRGHLPTTGPVMVVGAVDYGVLNRPAQPPFLLRHFCKAVAGEPQEVNSLQAQGAPLEVLAQFEPSGVALTAMLRGKPLPKAVFTTIDANLSNETIHADEQGRARFEPGDHGVYSVYIQHVDPTAGEFSGTAYKEVREFATVSFQWPLVVTQPDAQAVKLFEDALATRANWQAFPGFQAKVAGEVDGRPFAGSVKVAADGSVKLELQDDVVQDWVQQQLESITMHRAATRESAPHAASPSLSFADQDDTHPLGRLLAFHGGHFASSYRVKDRQIAVVNRLIDGENVTITVLDNEKNAEGKFLPRSYTVQYWDEASGNLKRTESVQDRWTRVGAFDLPTSHTVAISSSGGFTTRSLKLTEHTLAP